MVDIMILREFIDVLILFYIVGRIGVWVFGEVSS